MYSVPKSYRSEITGQFDKDFNALIDTINGRTLESSYGVIDEFCETHKTNVEVLDKNNQLLYRYVAVEEKEEEKDVSLVTKVVGTNNENPDYLVSTSAPMESVNQMVDALTNLLPYIMILIVAISVVVGWVCARLIAKPIVAISKNSEQISNLDLSYRSDIKRSDEIGQLADNLNKMASRLDIALKELKQANNQLEEEIQQRDNLFVAISHELKTPLTIIKCDLEGMIHNIGRYKDRETYLQHALNTTEVMENLVKEILSVIRLGLQENSDLESVVHLGTLVEDIVSNHEELANQKGIHLHLDIQNFEMILPVSHIKKVVSNIVSNAIFHSPNHEDVYIDLYEEGKTKVLSIENTGVHIDEAEIENIFRPLYLLDTSRSVQSQSSGLGLFIVKTILERYGFAYKMMNTSRGIVFLIYFT